MDNKKPNLRYMGNKTYGITVYREEQHTVLQYMGINTYGITVYGEYKHTVLQCMGNADSNMMKSKRKHQTKAVNPENIDVNRSKTLKGLQTYKCHKPVDNDDPNHYFPEHIQLSNIQRDSDGELAGQNAKSLKTTCLKDGRVVNETIVCNTTVSCDSGQQSSDTCVPCGHNSNMFSSIKSGKSDASDCVMPAASSSSLSVLSGACDVSTESSPEQPEMLTIDDVDRYCQGGKYSEVPYDAYVNCPPEYIPEASNIIKILEQPPYNFKLFLPERQMLAGGLDLDVKSYIVENRCSGKVISLLGKNYSNSKACHFINHFAKCLDPVSKEAKLIPVLIDEIDIVPRILKGMYLIQYNRDKDRGFFYKKLSKSIQSAIDSETDNKCSSPSNSSMNPSTSSQSS